MLNIKSKILDFKSQSGQTLIETLAALFILVMGITSSVGLALYAFSTSSAVTKQIVAAGIAREGVEAVKNIRDMNWLKYTTSNCYDFATASSTAGTCFTQWLGTGGSVPFCIDPTNNAGNCNGLGLTKEDYALGIDSSFGSSGTLWHMYRQRGGAQYGMSFDPTNSSGMGFYNQDGNTDCAGTTIADYCRKITTTAGTVYDPATYGGAQNPGPLLFVQSEVWWVDKKCPRVLDFTSAPAGCKVELDTYLSNWKNYKLP
jgi:hypothetical protein